MYRCKLCLTITLLFQENLWDCLIQICQPILLALESRGVHLKGALPSGAGWFLLLCAVFIYCTILKTFIQVFKAKTPIPIVRQENVQEVHRTDLPKIKKKFIFSSTENI